MEKNKLKLLRVLEILNTTDEDHSLTTNRIISQLQLYGIESERKSVLRDIATLNEAGYEILLHSDNKRGYYMVNRRFEDWELKILCDAVSSAKFLTLSETRNLIEKISEMSSTEGCKTIRSITPMHAVIKNDSAVTKIYIDTVMQAIRKKRRIKFQYVYTDAQIKKQYRRDGFEYILSPYSLIWRNERYYLIGNYQGYGDLSLYSLDRIRNLSVTEDEICSPKDILGENPDLKINEYIKKTIYNYGGKEITLTLRFHEYMTDELTDHFGSELHISKHDDFFETSIRINESDGLYYWLLQFGENITVVSPENVKKELVRRLDVIRRKYC